MSTTSKKEEIPEWGSWGDGKNTPNMKELVEQSRLPFCPGGFFWGHQFQEESQSEYEEQDLEFCETALQMLDKGHTVVYECWW